MAKTVKGKKIVPVKPYTRKVDGKKVPVKRHKRSTPAGRQATAAPLKPIRKTFLFLLCRQRAIIRLLSFLITFAFRVSVMLFAVFLKLFGVISLDFWGDVLRASKALSIPGITPLFLSAFSWRLFEKLCHWFIRWYHGKYFVS